MAPSSPVVSVNASRWSAKQCVRSARSPPVVRYACQCLAPLRVPFIVTCSQPCAAHAVRVLCVSQTRRGARAALSPVSYNAPLRARARIAPITDWSDNRLSDDTLPRWRGSSNRKRAQPILSLHHPPWPMNGIPYSFLSRRKRRQKSDCVPPVNRARFDFHVFFRNLIRFDMVQRMAKRNSLMREDSNNSSDKSYISFA